MRIGTLALAAVLAACGATTSLRTRRLSRPLENRGAAPPIDPARAGPVTLEVLPGPRAAPLGARGHQHAGGLRERRPRAAPAQVERPAAAVLRILRRPAVLVVRAHRGQVLDQVQDRPADLPEGVDHHQGGHERHGASKEHEGAG